MNENNIRKLKYVLNLSVAHNLSKDNYNQLKSSLAHNLMDICYRNLKCYLYNLTDTEMSFIHACAIVGREEIENQANETEDVDVLSALKKQFEVFRNGSVAQSKFDSADYLLGKSQLDKYLLKIVNHIEASRIDL